MPSASTDLFPGPDIHRHQIALTVAARSLGVASWDARSSRIGDVQAYRPSNESLVFGHSNAPTRRPREAHRRVLYTITVKRPFPMRTLPVSLLNT